MAKIVSMAALSTKTFEATLERGGGRLHWTIVRIPFDVHKLWGKRGQIRVKGEIRRASNLAPAFAFCTSLFPTGHGSHYLVVNKRSLQGPIPSVARMVDVGRTDLSAAPQPFPDEPPAPSGGTVARFVRRWLFEPR